MVKYAVILLDRTSTAFCHADNPYSETQLMPLDVLKEAIVWCMKENLRIQFVYPDYQLPQEYLDIINTIDHTDIKHIESSDVVVFNGTDEIREVNAPSIVIRISKDELFDGYNKIVPLLDSLRHISIVIIDMEKFTPEDFQRYQVVLSCISKSVKKLTLDNKMPQIGILTDRLALSNMNNCNAGDESITIAPNGKFYICPSFYYDDEKDSVGTLSEGLRIKNSHLYKLAYAPICRNCDAYHCRRCVWLNRTTTLEVNTPSHEQCVISHLERNAGRNLLEDIRKRGEFLPNTFIEEIDYLDPLDKVIKVIPQ